MMLSFEYVYFLISPLGFPNYLITSYLVAPSPPPPLLAPPPPQPLTPKTDECLKRISFQSSVGFPSPFDKIGGVTRRTNWTRWGQR